jgi:transposase
VPDAPLGRRSQEVLLMEVVYPRCAGLDVGKKEVVVCALTPGHGGRPIPEVRRFGTMTADLVALGDWLAERRVTHVAMESTGVYWQPIWNLLEERFTLLLVNAHHVKQVPGRKTDVKDSEWLAQLLRHGLLRPSFIPERAQRDLRELVRYRTSLIQERTAHINRLQKALEGANIKLAGVASEVTGVSARQMLAALVAGEDDPAVLANLAKGRLRDKLAELERALAGHFGAHHRYLVARILAAIDFLDGEIADLSARIAELERPFEAAIQRLDGIPGVGRRIAEILLAELGPDLAAFPSARHLASWAGLCPGNHESAGKRHSGRTRKGNRWLRTALVEAGHATRLTATYLGAQYRRLVRRRGKHRAAVAVGHSILGIVYHLLTTPEATYHDLGPDYFERRDRTLEQRLIRRLERRGYTVTPKPKEAA